MFMNKVFAMVINETQKALSRKITIAFLVLTFLLPIGFGLLFEYVQSSTAIQVMTGSNFVLSMLWLYTTLFLPLFVMMLASDLFVAEIADRSLKIWLVRPLSRFKIFLSKTLVISLFVLFSLGVLYTISTLCGGLMFNVWNASDVVHNLVAYIVAALPMVVLGIFAVCIGQFFRSISGAFALCVALFAIAKVIPIFFPSVGAILFTTYTDWQSLSIKSAVLLLSSYVLLFTSAWYLFDKKEL